MFPLTVTEMKEHKHSELQNKSRQMTPHKLSIGYAYHGVGFIGIRYVLLHLYRST